MAKDSEFASFRITLDVTVRRKERPEPGSWDFYDLLDIDGINDNLNVVSVVQIPLNDGHVEQMEES